MSKTEAPPMEFIPETLQALSNPGLLLASLDAAGRPNAMTIGWGSVGIYWRRPIFVVPVRRSRYTYECIEATGDFTVNVLPRQLAQWAEFCGTRSGRDHDKFAEAHMTAAPALRIKSPIVSECLLHYECKVVHANDLAPERVPREMLEALYPARDFHRFFFGEILAVQADGNLRERL